MNSEITILKLMLNHKEESFTIRSISKNTKINYRIAYEKVMLLEKEGLINITTAGSSKLCIFTGEFNRKIYETEVERQKDLFRNKDFLILKNRLSELKFPFIALLFGSYAKGTANKHSDIDILAIGGDEREIKTAITLLPDKIHLTCITYENFIHMAKSKDFTVVSETIKNNIILIGIEEYYRLIKNAK
jgi:predicted nucleotidyltransferase